jgi:hypothetical protein
MALNVIQLSLAPFLVTGTATFQPRHVLFLAPNPVSTCFNGKKATMPTLQEGRTTKQGRGNAAASTAVLAPHNQSLQYLVPWDSHSWLSPKYCNMRKQKLGCGLNMKFPTQAHMLNTWSPDGNAILRSSGNLGR